MSAEIFLPRSVRMRFRLRRVACVSLAAALGLGACQRTFLNPGAETPGANPTASLATALPPSGDRTAVVTRVEGGVEARADAAGPWAAAREGLALAEGSQIRTGAAGQAFITFTEGSKIQLGPDTTITFNIFYPDLNSPLTSLGMSAGKVWVLLRGGALDVETPLDIASARDAFMSVAYAPQTQALTVTCLQGTCSFGSLFIPALSKLVWPNPNPEPMSFADYGEWGANVPEATQLAGLATEALAQGSATLPVVATGTPTPPPPTATPGGDQPTTTPQPSSPTAAAVIRSATPAPFTPIPPAPVIGRHVVRGGETIFCIGRGYGVLPAASIRLENFGETRSLPQTGFPTRNQEKPACKPNPRPNARGGRCAARRWCSSPCWWRRCWRRRSSACWRRWS